MIILQGMIFGIGAAAIFYVTTGQCYHDIKSAFVNTCCSRSIPNTDRGESSDDRRLLLEKGGSTSEKKMYGT